MLPGGCCALKRCRVCASLPFPAPPVPLVVRVEIVQNVSDGEDILVVRPQVSLKDVLGALKLWPANVVPPRLYVDHGQVRQGLGDIGARGPLLS